MNQRPRGRPYGRVLWVLLATAIVRIWVMPLGSSFWVDEMATAFVVEHGASHPSFAVAAQVPDSLYYWLPRASVAVFGRSEIAYRVPGLLVMGMALWLIGALAARLIDPDARWFAIFACFAMHGIDYYAVDARPYGLGILVAAAAMWFLVRWLDGARWSDGLAFAVCASLLWRVHLLDWPMYLVFGCCAVASVHRKVGWKRAAVLFGLVVLALTPVAWHAAGLAREAAAHVIAPLPGWREFLHQVRLNLVAICLAAAWLVSRRAQSSETDRSRAILPIGAWWLMPPICLFALSHLTGQSVFLTRYVSIALPGAALAATLAASIFLPPRCWRVGAIAVGVGALAAMGQWGELWPAHEHSGWREAAAAVNRMAGQETPVICPSPFVEARRPAWTPDYALPGFLYAHLKYYPIHGRILPFPFEGVADSMPLSGPILIYGGRGGVRPLERWYTDRGWRSQAWEFGDVVVVRVQSNVGVGIALRGVREGTLLKHLGITAAFALCLVTGGSLASLKAQQTPPPDNTGVNKRDRSSGAPTADQGKNNASDLQLMKKIRKSIMDDKTLSTYAHNVKVIAQDGKVTLKGPVRSEEEKRAVEQKAAADAGDSNVVSELTVKPKS